MNIFRNILIGLASFIFITSVTGFVYIFTLHTTIMDRTVVKSWLNESSLYDGRLIGALVQTTTPSESKDDTPQPATDNLNASPEDIKTALNATFTPEFTKTQIEGVIDNAYDWIDGTKPEFAFSIPIDEKRNTLIAELAKAIEPQVAALPICQSVQAVQGSVCRPANISIEQLANQLTAESINQSDTFAKPITNESFTSASQPTGQQPNQTSITQLPAMREAINVLLIALPIATIVSLAIIIFATVKGQRLARSARLARRVFFGMLFVFLPAALIVWFAKDNDFGLSSMFAAQTGTLAVPLIKTIGIGMLVQLAIISGIVGAISAVIWIALSIRNHMSPEPVQAIPPAATPALAVPSQPQQTELPQNPPSDYHRY